jgi:SAM-dependent methyltransferase
LSTEPIARIKQGGRWLWSQGDYTRLAVMLEPEALQLARQCVRPGMRVLDVAAGNGNFALEAARLGADVTASDITPHMVDLGRARSGAAALEMTWLEADAESLPFPDGSFDLVATVFGAQFAPRPELVANEMFRVVRSSGIVAMANYSPEGFFGRLSETIGSFSTTQAPDLPSPFLWGDPDEVRARLEGRALTIELEPRSLTISFQSVDDWQHRFADVNPPLKGLEQLLPPPAFGDLMRRVRALVEELNTGRNGQVVLDSSYLVVIARKLVTSPRE